jgi:predicted RNA-binding Zn-ribbon protein involved in translation (DUF1610 family)
MLQESQIDPKPECDLKRCVDVIPISTMDHDYNTYGQPGKACKLHENLLHFACPGCGQYGSIRCGHPKPESPSWDIEVGTLEDPRTLTLSPSINCVGCCGWHGYLRSGRFEAC